jgi:hypothetical protein
MSRFSFALNDAPPPDVAVELGARRIAGAALEWRGEEPTIAAHGIEPLAEGALVPSLTQTNIHDRAAVSGAVGRLLVRLGRPRRVGLVVPDPVARVSLEEAQVSYVDAGIVTGGHEFIVTVARRDVIREYEDMLAAHGAHAGLVDISTFNVINAVLAGSTPPAGDALARAPSSDDWLLVNVAADWASIAILRGPQLIFFRTRSADADGTLADLVHQTAMYYEDRLQGTGFGRVVVCGASAAGVTQGEEVRRGLEERLAMTVEAIDIRAAAALTDRISAAPALLDTLAPLAGLLLRDTEAV